MPPLEPLDEELVVDFGESGRHPLPWEIEAAELKWEQDIAEIAAQEDAEAFVNAMGPDDDEDDDPDPDALASAEDADEEAFH